MPIPIAVALMAATTAAKMKQDADREKDERDIQVATTRSSPWTGMKSQMPTRADMAGTAMQGIASMYGQQQAGQTAEAQAALMKAQADYLKNKNANSSLNSATEQPTRYTPPQGPMTAAKPPPGMSFDDWMAMQQPGYTGWSGQSYAGR